MNVKASPYIMCRMSDYIPDDAAMQRNNRTWHATGTRQRVMNRLQAHKDHLIDLLGTRPPTDERKRLNAELTELKQDIAKNRYDESERTWLDLERKWGRRG